MASKRQRNNLVQAGFSLIEALIALVILSVGLLGIAAIQTQALLQSREAYLTSQATSLVQDMADRVRANPSGNYNHGANSSIPSGSTLAATDLRGWLQDLQTTLPGGEALIEVDNDRLEITVTWQVPADDEDRSITIATEL